MDILNELLTFLQSFWEIILVATASVALFLKGIFAYLSRLLAPLVTKIQKFFGKKENNNSSPAGVEKGMKYGKSPKAALLMAQQRKRQMQAYIDAWEHLVMNKWGPYALSARLHSFMHTSLHDKLRRKKERLKEFDTIEDHAQRLVHLYDADREQAREALVQEACQLNRILAVSLARQMNWALKPFSKKSKAIRRTLRRKGMRYGRVKFDLYMLDATINRKYRPKMAGLAADVDFFSKEFLDDWMGSSSADITSMELSSICGNVREYVLHPEHAELRKKFGLCDDLSDAALMRFLAPYNVPLLMDGDNLSSTPETLFEMYLRIKLYANPNLRQAWGVNLVFLDKIAAPGSLGISHSRYMQLGSNTCWFQTPQSEKTD